MDVTIASRSDLKDWLDFFSSLAASLIWPLFLAATLWFFRKEIRDALSKISSVGVGSVVAEFDRGLKQAETLAAPLEPEEIITDIGDVVPDASTDAIEADPSQTTGGVSDIHSPQARNPATPKIDRIRSRTRRSGSPAVSYSEYRLRHESTYGTTPGSTPEEKIVNAWDDQEALIHDIAEQAGVPESLPTIDKISALGGMNVLDKAFSGLLASQLNLRNVAAHAGRGTLSELQAESFLEQIQDSKARLEELMRA